ncbi:MAG: LysR family transcriptional regulator [Caulobacteraceae bacterium]|nr:LysR family transcriptional regulator [Caulobacteraceae bacterium]
MDPLERSLRSTNLNLLPVLRAVLKHRNLTKAAAELNITQSGVSNSLRQLRAHFDDELLVRDGRTLRLTEKAKSLIEPLERALSAVERVLANTRFEPAIDRRRFRVATADYVTAITAPRMAAIMGRDAPGMTVQMVTARAQSVADLRAGNIDMIISPRQIIEAGIYDAPNLMREFTFEPLTREPFVCLGRADDEAFARGLTAEEYLARPHASFHLDLSAHASLEHGYLIEHGIDQFNRILTSDFTVLPLIAARSDCIVLAPRSLAQLVVEGLPLRIGPCPLPFPDLELVMVWSRGRTEEPELLWLRDLLKRCVEPPPDHHHG